MRSKKGITLVSLVVTIIVLIILAGVSINLTLGENGIITMAKKVRENMEFAKVDEERQLNELYMQMEQEGLLGEISYDAIAKLVEFKKQIASAITDMGIDTAENADASTMSSNIRNLTGASSADKISYDNTNSGLTATNVQGALDELNGSLVEDENGMTVHEKLDKLLNGYSNFMPYNFEYITAKKGGNYTTSLTFNDLEIGEKYLFSISQYSDGNAGITNATGLAVIYDYQSQQVSASSGAPGILYGVATEQSVTINFTSHNGGISAIAFKIPKAIV